MCMSWSGDDRYIFQSAPINFALCWKSNERVALTLDFVPVNTSIHHSKVNARNTLAQTEFLNDESIVLRIMAAFHLTTQS